MQKNYFKKNLMILGVFGLSLISQAKSMDFISLNNYRESKSGVSQGNFPLSNKKVDVPNFSCYYGDGLFSNNVEGTFPIGPEFAMSNSVDLTKGLKVKEFRFNFYTASEIQSLKVYVRADNNGIPGEILHTVEAPFTTKVLSDTGNDFQLLEVTIPVTNSFDLPVGKYWIQPVAVNDQNPDVAWETTTTGTSGSSTKITFDGGDTWMDSWDSNTAVFFISGDCLTTEGPQGCLNAPYGSWPDETVILTPKCDGKLNSLVTTAYNGDYTYVMLRRGKLFLQNR